MDGIIIKGIGGFYYVKAADGCIYECRARGKFRRERVIPVIGDRVEIETSGEKGSVVNIYERKNRLERPAVANIDALVIVAAAASPAPDTRLIDKLTASALSKDIEPVICVNKTDLADGRELVDIYGAAGFKTVSVSALTGDGISDGISALTDILKDKVSAFAGLSGVGKSSILNRITGTDARTGSVSEKIRRGRHTTRHVELFELPEGGYVLDTPGFSSFELTGIKAGELGEYFPEIASVTGCRFKGCSHINEPDCAVKALVSGGKIAPCRYESYAELYNILKEIKDWEQQ